MKTDKSQDKYDEIVKDLKKEKLDWDFEDFLKEAEKEEKILPINPEKKSASFPKFYWLAASLVLLAALGIFMKFVNTTPIEDQDQYVKNQILQQKDSLYQVSNLAVNEVKDSLKIKTDSLISDSATSVNENDIMDQILPKRGRLKRQTKPHYAQNDEQKSATKKSVTTPDYESNYVIINGQKIENEQEAIDLTKYSFRILSENVSKTVAQTEALNSFSIDN